MLSSLKAFPRTGTLIPALWSTGSLGELVVWRKLIETKSISNKHSDGSEDSVEVYGFVVWIVWSVEIGGCDRRDEIYEGHRS